MARTKTTTQKRAGRAAELTLFALLASPLSATAQGDAKATTIIPNQDLKAPPAHPEGLDYTLQLSATFSLSQNDSVVGQLQGVSYIIGGGIVGTLDYFSGPSEFTNRLTLIESFSKTPALDVIVKTNDVARLESQYAYFFLQWLGGFAQAKFETPILKTVDYQAGTVDYTIRRTDGTVETRTGLTEALLAKGFEPFTMTQSLGLALRPLEIEPAVVTVRVGIGGRETLTGGALLRVDDAATAGVIELVETEDVFQGGVEAAVGVSGRFPLRGVGYTLDFAYLLPVVNNDDTDRDALELSRIAFNAALTYSMWEWLGLAYQLRLLDDPQLVDALQIQNNIVLSLKYDLIPAKKAAEAAADPLKVAEEQAKAAEERARAAEERARIAEERARAAEARQLEGAPPEAPTPEPPPPPSATP